MELLFSYGTLQNKKVQLETYGRKLVGDADRILGFKLERVEITDDDVLSKSNEKHHPIAIPTGSSSNFIDGFVYKISNKELQATDDYEVDNYKRIKAKLESGKTCWIYIENK